jgi:hypothetical protein
VVVFLFCLVVAIVVVVVGSFFVCLLFRGVLLSLICVFSDAAHCVVLCWLFNLRFV